VNLITLMFAAPLIGCDPESPDILHAVTMEGVTKGWVPVDGNDPWFTSACGTSELKLVGSDELLVPWPPRVSSLTGPMVRCRDCQRLTGNKRPRSSWRPKVNA
jgi:hypothetical protein